MHKGVVIVFPWEHWDSHPTMHQLGQELLRSFGRLLIVSPDGLKVIQREAARNPPAARKAGKLRALAILAWQRLPATGLRGRLVRWGAWLFRPFVRQRYAAVLGVDPLGLVFAAELGRAWNLPLAYASFEILFRNELSARWEEQLKQAELEAADLVRLALVQDPLRGKILCEENNLTADRLVFVPVAPLPVAATGKDMLRGKLGLSSDQRILLMAGSLDAFCSRDLLVSMADLLPKNFQLVIHARATSGARRGLFLDQLARHPRISVSRDFLPLEDLHELYASADYALVSYSPNPEGWTTYQNIFNIGSASGKAAYAAMCGLPLVTSNLPTYRNVFATYHCGAAYEKLQDIPEILSALEADYAHHAKEARRYYDEQLDPREGLRNFRTALIKVCGRGDE
jgi:glycosyltransferase involved in cell wall biosynthesis